ncbi:MAG: hypothetical protein RR515_03855, partial [Clostridium sp.]
MITIGIVSSQKSEIGNIIKNYILKRRKSVLFIENYNYKIIDSNRNNFNFVIYQINSDDILSNQVEWGEFDIILENISEDNEEEINALQKIIRSIKKG